MSTGHICSNNIFTNMGYNRLQIQSPILLPETPISSTTKGLLNGPGQNNCFLNSAVQVSLLLFHLKKYIQKYSRKT